MTTTQYTTVSFLGMPSAERVAAAKASGGSYKKSTIAAWERRLDDVEIAAALVAATRARCACGYHGDWSRAVHGTSGTTRVIWAGCSCCSGRAVGSPVTRSQWVRWARLSDHEQAQNVAAVICRETGKTEVRIDLETLDSTFDVAE